MGDTVDGDWLRDDRTTIPVPQFAPVLESTQPHRLTLVQWVEEMGYLSTGDVVTEQRWTAACDCGWHSTTSESVPGGVLRGYSDHLEADDAEQPGDADETPFEFWTPDGSKLEAIARVVADAHGDSGHHLWVVSPMGDGRWWTSDAAVEFIRGATDLQWMWRVDRRVETPLWVTGADGQLVMMGVSLPERLRCRA